MERIYIVILFLCQIGITVSHAQVTKNNSVYVFSNQYAIEISTWGMPGTERFQVIYNNIPNHTLTNAHLLYVIRQSIKEDKLISDTITVKLNQTQLDTIYQYTHIYLQDFQLDNRLLIGSKEHPVEIIYDGTSFSIAFEHNNKRLEATQRHVRGFDHASPVMGKLMAYINSKLPEYFKVY